MLRDMRICQPPITETRKFVVQPIPHGFCSPPPAPLVNDHPLIRLQQLEFPFLTQKPSRTPEKNKRRPRKNEARNNTLC